MKNSTWTYPRYFKNKDGLLAFLAKDEMYAITNQGRNMNAGICIDYYKTRRLVLRHQEHPGEMISREEFIRLYKQLFENTLQFITDEKW